MAARAMLGAFAVTAMACGTKEAPTGLQPNGPVGRIRFVNLITDPTKNPVNAILDRVPFGVNLGYGGSTPSSLPAPNTANYSSVLAGDNTLELKKTADTTVSVATFKVTIGANEDWTVYALNGGSSGPISALSTKDDNTAVIPAGQTAVRIVTFFSNSAGLMDVFITAPNADLSTATPVNTSNTLFSPPVNVPAISSYQVRAVPAGTAPANRNANVIVSATPNVPLTAGTAHTIVIAEKAAGGGPAVVFVLTDR